MPRCPLRKRDAKDLDQGVDSLLPKCDKAGCSFHKSDLDTDYMPSGCIVLVVAMLEAKRERQRERAQFPQGHSDSRTFTSGESGERRPSYKPDQQLH